MKDFFAVVFLTSTLTAQAAVKELNFSSQNGNEAFDHEVRLVKSRGRYTVRALLQSGNYVQDSEYLENHCKFDAPLSLQQSKEVDRLATKLKVCYTRPQEVNDATYDRLIVRMHDNMFLSGYRTKDELGDYYYCRGAEVLYRYVGSLVKPLAPAKCPADYVHMF
ncbi:MAG TPA: hypothetical protein VNJ01_18225 [Bacteriovoracaceae bacterium]|nr:hypothetical protein [Bacteriovoracaceae bacterium]